MKNKYVFDTDIFLINLIYFSTQMSQKIDTERCFFKGFSSLYMACGNTTLSIKGNLGDKSSCTRDSNFTQENCTYEDITAHIELFKEEVPWSFGVFLNHFLRPFEPPEQQCETTHDMLKLIAQRKPVRHLGDNDSALSLRAKEGTSSFNCRLTKQENVFTFRAQWYRGCPFLINIVTPKWPDGHVNVEQVKQMMISLVAWFEVYTDGLV